MKRTLRAVIATAISALFFNSVSLAQDAPQYSKLVVFGDSLSDNGNLYRRTLGIYPKSPPYYKGRFSNGLLWEEYLSEYLGLSANQLIVYAIGGAKGVMYPVTDVPGQVNEYMWLNGSSDPNGLYVVWGGANNLLDAYEKSDHEQAVKQVLDSLSDSISRLANHGATQFMVPNLPNMGITARAKEVDESAGNHEYSETFSRLTELFNTGLKVRLDGLQQALNIKIEQIDIYRDLDELIKQAKDYGITNIDTACNPNDLMSGNKPICSDPEHYLFWDGIHPTTVAHQILAKMIFAELAEAQV